MKQTKTEKTAAHLSILRDRSVVLDYDLTDNFNLSMEEIDAIVMAQRDKFIRDDVMEISETERTKLLQEPRFESLEEKPYLRWAFTFTGMSILVLQLRDRASIAYAHKLVQTYSDVASLQEIMKQLTDSKDPATRDELFCECNQLMNKVIAGDNPSFACFVRSVDARQLMQPEPQVHQPFSHPESRYDPITKRFWLSEEEIVAIRDTLCSENHEMPIHIDGVPN